MCQRVPAALAGGLLALACSASPLPGSNPDSGAGHHVAEAGQQPDSGPSCTAGSAEIPDFSVFVQASEDTYDGPGAVVQPDAAAQLEIRPDSSDAGAWPIVYVSFHGWKPAALPAVGDHVWVTLRDAVPGFAGFVFAAVRKSQGGELYFAYLDDTFDDHNAAYFSTPDAAGAAISVADACNLGPNGCFKQSTLLRVTFKADTTLMLGSKESGVLWSGGQPYQVFVRGAVRNADGTGGCTDTFAGTFLTFFLVQQPLQSDGG